MDGRASEAYSPKQDFHVPEELALYMCLCVDSACMPVCTTSQRSLSLRFRDREKRLCPSFLDGPCHQAQQITLQRRGVGRALASWISGTGRFLQKPRRKSPLPEDVLQTSLSFRLVLSDFAEVTGTLGLHLAVCIASCHSHQFPNS